MDDLRLLARSVVLVDKDGIVRYIQMMPEITRLPDMEKAFAAARELKASQAKREVAELLDGVIQVGAPSYYLSKTKESTEPIEIETEDAS